VPRVGVRRYPSQLLLTSELLLTDASTRRRSSPVLGGSTLGRMRCMRRPSREYMKSCLSGMIDFCWCNQRDCWSVMSSRSVMMIALGGDFDGSTGADAVVQMCRTPGFVLAADEARRTSQATSRGQGQRPIGSTGQTARSGPFRTAPGSVPTVFINLQRLRERGSGVLPRGASELVTRARRGRSR